MPTKLALLTDGDTTVAGDVAQPLVDRQSGEQRRDAAGKLLSVLLVVWLHRSGGADVVAVRSTDITEGIVQGSPVRLVGLTATPWAMDGRSGISYTAERIERAGRDRREQAGAAETQ